MQLRGRIIAVIILFIFRGSWMFYYHYNFEIDNVIQELIISILLIFPVWWIGKQFDKSHYYLEQLKIKQQELEQKETDFTNLIELSPHFLLIHQGEQIVYVNPETVKMLGAKTKGELEGRSIYDMIPASEYIEFKTKLEELKNGYVTQIEELIITGFNGQLSNIKTIAVPTIYKQRPAIMSIGINLTDYKHVEKKLNDIDFALNESTIIAITDKDGVITHVNDKFCTISKYTKNELIGNTHRIIKSGQHSSSFFKEMWETIRGGEVWKGEIKNRAKDGSYYWVDTTIVPFLDRTGAPYQYVAIRNDITNIKEMEEKSRYLANYDTLTKLPNRQHINQFIQQEIEKQNESSNLALLFIDLDGFKLYNDTLGHNFGDELLKEVPKRMKRCLPKDSFLGRYAGDEFIIIMKEKDEQQINNLASNINKTFEEPFYILGKELFITLSIGISLYPKDGTDAETLIKNADAAMYRSKRETKNNYQFYREEFNESNKSKVNIENGLRWALRNHEFHLLYQPQYELHTKSIVGAEALIRWKSPTLGDVSPAEFIPIAEDTGLIVPISKWVFNSACKQCKQWHDAGLKLKISVNISLRQFYLENIIETVREVLLDTNLEPKYLNLEITESIFQDINKSKHILKSLKELGVMISIDDFGTGYSSLAILNQLPIDFVKIDRSFIKDIPNDENSIMLVKTIRDIGKNLNYEIVAEGVENTDQLKFLQQNKCQIAQGFYFSKPIFSEKIVRLVDTFYEKNK
ncbi:EAL domain-containing protein [Bacillus shivajii]|uniref:EAL domain-containing protein n=1 Tax=Bacillus shivajii TaxID=1983719 RepID=UPI001CF9D2C4|nr:EAL domain-containing protein [Bacillus shivajii]UCZ55320.1 EAL domain-containing protein [Bacillus shivajii]